MSHSRDGVNSLRPYYIPPSIGEPSDPLPTLDPHVFSRSNVTGNYASKAREIFSDLDYKNYISHAPPSVVQSARDVIDDLVWKYTSVLLAQPFEVAKTILQVRRQDDPGSLSHAISPDAIMKTRSARPIQDDPDMDSDPDDEPVYFTPNMPSIPTPYPRSSQQYRPSSRSSIPLQAPQSPQKPEVPPYQLTIRNPDSVLEAIGQLWTKEGAWGVWKGSNTTFFYAVLQSLLEKWSRSLLSALLNVPDLGVRDDMDRLVDLASPYPWASLCVAAAAAATTGLILSPLDLVRTRLMLTPTSRTPRSTVSALCTLSSYICPSRLFVPTVLHAIAHPLLTLSTPLILRTRFFVNGELSPVAFSVAKFCTSSVALFIKLPLETVLRRGQMAVLSSTHHVQHSAAGGGTRSTKQVLRDRHINIVDASHIPPSELHQLETMVPSGKFAGVLGTMYTIINQEGSRVVLVPMSATARARARAADKSRATAGTEPAENTTYRRGQGLAGLWRGWKVSWWGLVGLWAAGVAGNGGNGQF